MGRGTQSNLPITGCCLAHMAGVATIVLLGNTPELGMGPQISDSKLRSQYFTESSVSFYSTIFLDRRISAQ